MKSKMLFSTIIVTFALAGCSALQPDTTPIEFPKPVTYEHKYEIIDTRASCQPISSVQAALLKDLYDLSVLDCNCDCGEENPTLFFQPLGPTTREELKQLEVPIESTRSVVLCVQTELQTGLAQLENAGWELIEFQALNTSPYDLGIQYAYLTLWQKQK